jgi:hypothetical protein
MGGPLLLLLLLLLLMWRLCIRSICCSGRLQRGRSAARPRRLIRQGRRGHALPCLRYSTSAWKRCHTLQPGFCTLFSMCCAGDYAHRCACVKQGRTRENVTGECDPAYQRNQSPTERQRSLRVPPAGHAAAGGARLPPAARGGPGSAPGWPEAAAPVPQATPPTTDDSHKCRQKMVNSDKKGCSHLANEAATQKDSTAAAATVEHWAWAAPGLAVACGVHPAAADPGSPAAPLVHPDQTTAHPAPASYIAQLTSGQGRATARPKRMVKLTNICTLRHYL